MIEHALMRLLLFIKKTLKKQYKKNAIKKLGNFIKKKQKLMKPNNNAVILFKIIFLFVNSININPKHNNININDQLLYDKVIGK